MTDHIRALRVLCARTPSGDERDALESAIKRMETPQDLRTIFDVKARWSLETFGPGQRLAGILAHIRKELLEIEADPTDLEEWVDVVMIAMDGAWRVAGADGAAFVAAMLAKHEKNKLRTWPDWRTASPDHPIEHVKTPTK